MDEQTRLSDGQRAPYAKPVLENLGSLSELTEAGGPNFGFDSAYVPGDFSTFGES
jgi:hypothetical protein